VPALQLDGIFAPIPTPFGADGDVDERELAGNVARWAASPLLGLLALGSNGEALLLTEDESDRVVDVVRGAWPRDRMLLVGVGRESTRATMAAAGRAASRGADAVLVRTPSAFRSQMSDAALVSHFTAVADASLVPVLLYNLPGATGFSLTRPVIDALAGHPNIAGMKETSPDLDRLGQFAAVDPAGFRVLSGWAPVLLPALCAGAVGGILAVANVLPAACVTLHEQARAGRLDDALALQRRLTPLAQMVSTVHGVPGLKYALDHVGAYGGPVRPPLCAAPDAARDAIARELARWSATI
jgi:4-hydroxy-2-oxoglutarate aldolase